jgi:glycosyltransferase involved in cell wall biosynthesis
VCEKKLHSGEIFGAPTTVATRRPAMHLTYPFVLSWSMLEAMSAGCLIVGSRTQPVEEVIRDCGNGLLVNFFDPKEIAHRAVDALEDRRGHDSIRRNARQTMVDEYDLRTICLPAQLRLLQSVALQSPHKQAREAQIRMNSTATPTQPVRLQAMN